jgi:transposase
MKPRGYEDFVAAMYADYCSGMSIGDVAAKYGRSEHAVRLAFRQRCLTLRPQARKTTKEFLLANIQKTASGCWEWQGCRTREGYGQVARQLAHRLAYSLWSGADVPEGLQVMHSCDNPPCINPDHLRTGSNRDNSLDMVGKGRGCTTLTEEQVRTIRILYVSRHKTYGAQALAKNYGVSESTISGIVNRRRYAWVS